MDITSFLLLCSNYVIGDEARVDRQPAVVPDAANLRAKFRRQFQLDQRRHLPVAILFDDVDSIVFLKELDEMLCERNRAQPVVADRHAVFLLQADPAIR